MQGARSADAAASRLRGDADLHGQKVRGSTDSPERQGRTDRAGQSRLEVSISRPRLLLPGEEPDCRGSSVCSSLAPSLAHMSQRGAAAWKSPITWYSQGQRARLLMSSRPTAYNKVIFTFFI